MYVTFEDIFVEVNIEYLRNRIKKEQTSIEKLIFTILPHDYVDGESRLILQYCNN